MEKKMKKYLLATILFTLALVTVNFAPPSLAQGEESKSYIQVPYQRYKVQTATPSGNQLKSGYVTEYYTSTGPKYVDSAGTVTAIPTSGSAALSANRFIYAGTSGTLTAAAAATNGQLLIGSTGAAPALAALTGTSNQVVVTNGAGSITLSTPQSIHTAATPTFAGLTLSGLTANSFSYSGVGGLLTTTAAPTNGQLLIGSTGAAPVAAALTGTANQITVTNGAGSISLSTPQSIHTGATPTFADITLTGVANSPSYRQTTATGGAYAAHTSVTTELTGLSGASATATSLIPAGSIVTGVTIRVTTEITSGDGATSFQIGDGTDADRWGTGIVFTAGTTTSGSAFTITSVPIYAAATNVVLTATGGTFSAGAVRVTVHYISFVPASS
jgi:hypothetical protein